jgi:hypothetical protein
VADLLDPSDIADSPYLALEQLSEDILGAYPSCSTRIMFGGASHLRDRRSERETGGGPVDHVDQLVSEPFQILFVKNRLVVQCRPPARAAITHHRAPR